MDLGGEYPRTILFVQTSNDAFNIVRAVNENLKTLSQYQPKKWNISISTKVPRESKVHSTQNAKSLKAKSFLFAKFVDTGCTCVLNTGGKQKYSRSDIIVADENIEIVMTDLLDLVLRSTWKVQGQSFNLDDLVVSAGVLERGSQVNTSVVEFSCIGGQSLTNGTINRIYALIDSLLGGCTDGMFVFGDQSSSLEESNKESSGFTLADRCLQWVHATRIETPKPESI